MSKSLVYAGFALDGMGVVLLGALLPRLESAWGIRDAQGGALLAAMFFGMTSGTVLVLRDRRRAMFAGAACSGLGLLTLAALLTLRLNPAFAEGSAVATLFVYGFGLGQAITTLNIAAGAEALTRSGRLAFGNAMWSVGAILSPLLVALALRNSSLVLWLVGLSLLFPVIWIAAANSLPDATISETALRFSRAALPVVVAFSAIMFLYGSVESSVSGWVAAFAGRDGHAASTANPLAVSAFWFGVASGRVLASVLLRRMRDRDPLLLLTGGALLASLGLLSARSLLSVSLWAALCGTCIGPAFACIVSGVLSRGASARQTGTVLAMCGAGATIMPFLLGLVSQKLHSLRGALAVPGLCLVGMFLTALFSIRDRKFNLPAWGDSSAS